MKETVWHGNSNASNSCRNPSSYAEIYNLRFRRTVPLPADQDNAQPVA